MVRKTMVTDIFTMMYMNANGPTYQAVKNYVAKAVNIRNIAKLLVILDILKKGKTTYQFASAPKDKNRKIISY